MTPSDTIDSMPLIGRERPATPRELAGKAAKDLIGYAGMSQLGAGSVVKNLSYPTVKNIVAGLPSVRDASLQALAGVLHLPINFFLLIIDEDRAGLEALTMPTHVREYITDLLGPIESPSRRRQTGG